MNINKKTVFIEPAKDNRRCVITAGNNAGVGFVSDIFQRGL